MQKLFVIFLSVWYLVLSMGFTQYVHICKRMAVKVHSLTNTESRSDKPCPICAAKEKGLTGKKKDCCKQESKIVKVDHSFYKKSILDLSVKFWGEAIPNKLLGTVFDTSFASFETKKTNHCLSSKVPLRANFLYILHCVYRI